MGVDFYLLTTRNSKSGTNVICALLSNVDYSLKQRLMFFDKTLLK